MYRNLFSNKLIKQTDQAKILSPTLTNCVTLKK